jgi:hypothetical protein
VLLSSRTSQWQSVSQVRGRGGEGAAIGDCTFGLRHGVKGVVAVRWKIIVRRRVGLLRMIRGRRSGGRLCWRATCQGIAGWNSSRPMSAGSGESRSLPATQEPPSAVKTAELELGSTHTSPETPAPKDRFKFVRWVVGVEKPCN